MDLRGTNHQEGLNRGAYEFATFGIPLQGRIGFSVFENNTLINNNALQLPRGVEIQEDTVIWRARTVRHAGEPKKCLFV